MTKINDGQSAGTTFKPNESADNAKFQKTLQLAQHKSTQSTRSVTPVAVQRNGATKADISNINAPSTPLPELRAKLDKMLAVPGGDAQLQRFMKGEIPADQAKASLSQFQGTMNEFVRGSVVKEPSALSRFYSDYKDKFSNIIGAANATISDGADQVKYKLSELKAVASDHANKFITDDVFRAGVISAAVMPKGLEINPLDNPVTRLKVVGKPENVQRLQDTVDSKNRLKSQSESGSVTARISKLGAVTADTKVRVYRYPDGNAQIEFYSHVKGAANRSVEWNIGDTKTYKGRWSKDVPEGKADPKDMTYSFGEWIGFAGAEGAYTSKIFVAGKDGASGWDRAQSFLEKMKNEEGVKRFLPWKFIPAANKEFDSQKSGGTTSGGGVVDTKLYASTSLLPPNVKHMPESMRPVAAQVLRAYGESKGGLGINAVHNFNNSKVAVADEHTDSQNVQSEQYFGVRISGNGSYKGVMFIGDKPIVGGGASFRASMSAGVTRDAAVYTAEADMRTYIPKQFFDGRLNRGQIPKRAYSSQVTVEKGEEKILKLRERTIEGYFGQNARDVALNVNKREAHATPLTERLDLIKDKIPENVDLDKARKDLEGVFGRKINDQNWETFLDKQLDGDDSNNISSIGKSTRQSRRRFTREFSKWDTQINDWRERNNIDGLERSYQVNWPRTRDNIIEQGRTEIKKMDLAATSEYLRSRFVLTPGTSSYTILDGSLELQQLSAGQSVPNKVGESKKLKGLYKGTLYAENQQHERLGAFEVETKHRRVVTEKILGSDDRKLANAFLDIYNSQSYPTADQNGNRNLLRPIFSGDSRHIKRIIEKTGVEPQYGKSVYMVKPDDIREGDRASDVVGRMIDNGISQMSDGKESLETMYPNGRVRAAKLHQMVREFKDINFPGATDNEIMRRLEPGVPLMLMDFSKL